MIGIHKRRFIDWCNSNPDLLIIVIGAIILFASDQLVNLFDFNPEWQGVEFWALLIGVITISVGVSSLICYRILLKGHYFFT